MEILKEKVIFTDNAIKLVEKTYSLKKQTLDLDYFDSKKIYGYIREGDLLSDEELILGGAKWVDYIYKYGKALYLGDKVIYNETKYKEQELITFELKDDELLIKRANNTINEENYNTGFYGIKIDELKDLNSKSAFISEHDISCIMNRIINRYDKNNDKNKSLIKK